jgi:cytochrome P450
VTISYRENANSIPATFWLIVETLRQPHVFFQAREEITSSQKHSLLPDKRSFHLESLFSKPLLQSSYAEVLRLYASNIMMRNVVHQALCLENWIIPKGSLIAVDGHVAHMDKKLWNTGGATDEAEGSHPVSQFWAQRFLEHPDDPTSGPLRVKKPKNMAASTDTYPERKDQNPQFTMEGLSGAWIPYGGGSRQCPGNKFAKHQIILAFAAIISTFDIELLDDNRKGRTLPDMRYYGTGTLPPKGKTPFRIRRRHGEPVNKDGI